LNLQNIFFFLLFGPLLFSNLIIFLFLIHFKRFKMLQEHNLQYYKSSCYFNSNRATYKEFSGCSGISFGSVFWVLDPFYFGGGWNFLSSIPFLTIVSVSNVARGGFKFCLDIGNNRTLPLDPACPECLSVRSLADLLYMFGYTMKTKYMNLTKKNSHF